MAKRSKKRAQMMSAVPPAADAADESGEKPPQKKKKLRQAAESGDGNVQVLCFSCRHSSDKTMQPVLARFFAAAPSAADHARAPQPVQQAAADASVTAPPAADDGPLCCSRCRRLLEKKGASRGAADTSGRGRKPPAASSSRVLPHIQRIRQYQRVASEQGVPFAIGDGAAAALMRQPCVCCGAAAPSEGHGLTRLRIWPSELTRPSRGGFMGPFHPANLATACGTCNLMKGFRRIRGFVEAARHIATHRDVAGGGEAFGLYPRRFRDNISKRSRSSYISESSTHTKTHALSNEAFNALTARPCHYCGKASDPPRHHNGLDRLDSSVRVYSEGTCVSCCGDCNIMKYTHSEAAFLQHCLAVARHNVGVDAFAGDVAEDDDEVEEGGGEAEGGGGEDGGGEAAGGSGEEGGSSSAAAPAIVAIDEWEEEEAAEEAEEAEDEEETNPFAEFAFG